MPTIRVLSIHGDYGCQQRGACCAAGWPIPVEADRHDRLVSAMATKRLVPRLGCAGFDTPAHRPPGIATVLARPDGRCAFFDAEPGPSCRIHSTLGHDTLPLTCRQFPRISVRDPRGTSLTLSHYCPTAAAMLETSGEVAIVTEAPGFPAAGEYVGLDATDTLPPLLRPDMAMDWDAWSTWEQLSVNLLANGEGSIDADLARLRGIVDVARTWRPGSGPTLDAHLRRAFERAPSDATRQAPQDRIREIVDAIPGDVRPPDWPVGGAAILGDGPHRRLLAAHAFANWTAYLGLGLRAWLRSIEAAHALIVSGRSAAEVDLLLRHLADPQALARTWSAIERAPISRP